jgi:phenylpropionate dioxygenase-like ring-hydroxylating dioxygenase large terminal subunit
MNPETERQILDEMEAARQAGGQVHADTGLGTEALSSDVYAGGEARYRAEIERIFWRSWQPVARTSELAEPGWILRSVDRAEVVITRDDDGTLHAFHNTCRHRGSALVSGDGCGKRFVCPYHAWSYTLDGKLASLPEPRSYAPGFDASNIRLGRVNVDTAWGWVWINVREDAPSLGDFLGPNLRDELDDWRLETLEHKGRLALEGDFGWKLAVEGTLEPFHIPAVHRRSVGLVLDHRPTAMAWWDDHSRMVIPLRDAGLYEANGVFGRVAASAGVTVLPGLNTVQRTTNMVYVVFPAMALQLFPYHASVLTMVPLGPERTRVVLDVLGAPSKTDAERAFWDKVVSGYQGLFDEDCRAFRGVQRGLSGPYRPALELSHYDRRIRHFRRRIDAWLSTG